MSHTAKYGHCVKSVKIQFFSGPYFLAFGLNTGKYVPEKTLYLDVFRAVRRTFISDITSTGIEVPPGNITKLLPSNTFA